jgi:uncharacterized membrane protein YhaH (DUF805 family)
MMAANGSQSDGKIMRGTFWPIVLIVVGSLLLLSNLGILPLGELKALLARWWPLILILIGVFSLLKKSR